MLLSGGLDSATVLALARAAGRACYALSVDYGQRHQAELDAARRVAAALGAAEHRVIRVDYGQFGGSALTDDSVPVPTSPSSGIPVTYAPARNTVLLALALGWAEVIAAHEIHIGVNAVDYPATQIAAPLSSRNSNAWPKSPPRPEWRRAVADRAPLMHLSRAKSLRAVSPSAWTMRRR